MPDWVTIASTPPNCMQICLSTKLVLLQILIPSQMTARNCACQHSPFKCLELGIEYLGIDILKRLLEKKSFSTSSDWATIPSPDWGEGTFSIKREKNLVVCLLQQISVGVSGEKTTVHTLSQYTRRPVQKNESARICVNT